MRGAASLLLIIAEHAGHYVFADFCRAGSDCQPPITLTLTEAHDAVRRFVLPFLKVYHAGAVAWAPLLAPPAPPGFVYAAE